jgi:hypothetical protein
MWIIVWIFRTYKWVFEMSSPAPLPIVFTIELLSFDQTVVDLKLKAACRATQVSGSAACFVSSLDVMPFASIVWLRHLPCLVSSLVGPCHLVWRVGSVFFELGWVFSSPYLAHKLLWVKNCGPYPLVVLVGSSQVGWPMIRSRLESGGSGGRPFVSGGIGLQPK